MKDFMGKEIKVGQKVTRPVGRAGMMFLELREIVEVGEDYVRAKILNKPWESNKGLGKITRIDLLVVVED
jgi:hypothetical protein